jgi:hypothetical protein
MVVYILEIHEPQMQKMTQFFYIAFQWGTKYESTLHNALERLVNIFYCFVVTILILELVNQTCDAN